MIRWIASYPKSGNTWVRLFLLAYEDPDNFDANERPNHFRQDNDPVVYGRLTPVPFDHLTMDEVYLIRGNALVWLNRMAAEKPAYLKTHCANVTMDWRPIIPAGLTQSSLYLIRDPRDVVVSMADHLGWEVDATVEYMANEQAVINKRGTIRQPITTWSLNVQSWLRDLPYHQFALRYEDLLADPKRRFMEVLRHFGYLFDAGRFKRALALTTFDALRDGEDEHGYRNKSDTQKRFFREGRSGGWREALTAEQVARIEADHGEAMNVCGYI